MDIDMRIRGTEFGDALDDFASFPGEFQMEHDEAFLLVEACLYDRVPLLTSPEQVSDLTGISREQAMVEMKYFFGKFRNHCEWKTTSNGIIFLKVYPSFLEIFKRRSGYGTSYRGNKDAFKVDVRKLISVCTTPADSACECGHGKEDHDFDDGSHCVHCRCTKYGKKRSR